MSASLQHLDRDGVTVIQAYQWPQIQAGTADASARKFGAENNGSRVLANISMAVIQVATNDGFNQIWYARDTVTLSRPYGVTAVLGGAGAGGVWNTPGYRYYRVSALNQTGETIASIEVEVYVDDTTKRVTVAWTQVTGATGYRVWRTDVSGSYASPCLLTTIGSGATVSFLDNGSACSAGPIPPTVNTTAGAVPPYGTPPALAQASLVFGNVAVGQQIFYWVRRQVPAGTSEAGNDRLAVRQFTEN